MAVRSINSIWKSVPALEGAGVHLNRVFGKAEVPRLDPFLLLDDFSSPNPLDYLPGFPWHPHRGIETVTYILDGKVAHEDSLGNKGVIGRGDIQWMTSGSGIIHQEMPQKSKELTGFQLWVNMPGAKKMSDPRYQDVSDNEIHAIDYSGAKVKVIAGTVGKVKGPVEDLLVKPEYLDVQLPAGATFRHPVAKGNKVFAYLISGKGRFGNRDSSGREMVLFNDGSEVEISAVENLHFLLISGRPLGEPIAWYGPMVMNTQAEINKAIADFRNGEFVRQKPEF